MLVGVAYLVPAYQAADGLVKYNVSFFLVKMKFHLVGFEPTTMKYWAKCSTTEPLATTQARVHKHVHILTWRLVGICLEVPCRENSIKECLLSQCQCKVVVHGVLLLHDLRLLCYTNLYFMFKLLQEGKLFILFTSNDQTFFNHCSWSYRSITCVELLNN